MGRRDYHTSRNNITCPAHTFRARSCTMQRRLRNATAFPRYTAQPFDAKRYITMSLLHAASVARRLP